VAKLIFGVLLVAFLAWIVIDLGMQGRIESATGAAAVVNGEKVSSQELWMNFNQEMEGSWQSIRGTMSDADEREIRHTVLDRMINQTLAWQEAKRLGYAVTKDEVEAAIHAVPIFANANGQFDPARYQEALNRLGVPATVFELKQERDMSAARMESFVRESIRVTELELWLEYLRWHRRTRALVLKFPLAEAKDKVKVTPEEVKEYWNQFRREFEKEEKVRIRHIWVSINPQAGPEGITQAKAKIESALEELKKGADFADVARRKSEDSGTAARGGELGWFVKGKLIGPYEEKAFKLQTGQRTDAFQTDKGFHIIKCEARQKGEKPSFDDVQAKIRDKILTARAQAAIAGDAVRVMWQLRRDKDLVKAAAVVGKKPVDTGWFEIGKTPPPDLGGKTADAIAKALADREPGDVTDIVATGDGSYIARLVDVSHRRAPDAGFMKERPEIEKALLTRKQKAVYESWLDSLKAKAKIKLHIDAS